MHTTTTTTVYDYMDVYAYAVRRQVAKRSTPRFCCYKLPVWMFSYLLW